MPVFEARHVWKRYGPTVALRDVSIEVGEGLTVIMGPNGSGKTTLLRLLVGLSRPSRGTVRALGVDPWRRRPWVMARIGVAFEDLALPWWTTA
nr:ATP-binding cassette domain-containing protein [Desulfurococcales archaeon]